MQANQTLETSTPRPFLREVFWFFGKACKSDSQGFFWEAGASVWVLVAGGLVFSFRLGLESLAGFYIVTILLASVFLLALRFRTRMTLQALCITMLSYHATDLCFKHFSQRMDVYGDSIQYVKMMREGIFSCTLAPFRYRILTPLLAGPLNLFPVNDLHALQALNFGGLVATSYLLVRCLMYLGVAVIIGIGAPWFLYFSYLGFHAVNSQYLTDSMNYFFLALVPLALLTDAGTVPLSIVILLFALNSEKVVLILPLVSVYLVTKYGLKSGIKRLILALIPATLFLSLIRVALPSGTTVTGFFDRTWADLMADRYLHPFPHLSVPALLGTVSLPVTLLGLPLVYFMAVIQSFVATDVERMVAFSFVCIIPLALLSVQSALVGIYETILLIFRCLGGKKIAAALKYPVLFLFGVAWTIPYSEFLINFLEYRDRIPEITKALIIGTILSLAFKICRASPIIKMTTKLRLLVRRGHEV